MSIKRRIGYDFHTLYTRAELAKMYEDEGMSPDNAQKQAAILSRELGRMEKAEKRLWKQVREYEQIVGKDPEIVDPQFSEYQRSDKDAVIERIEQQDSEC